MDLQQKVAVANRAIDSISRHDDEDAAVRLVMLDKVDAHIKAEREAINDRVSKRLAELGAVATA